MFFKKLKCKFWSFIWFFFLPACLAFFIEFCLVKYKIFSEMAPWRILLILALAAFGLLSIKVYLPFWYDEELESIEDSKKVRKESSRILQYFKKYIAKKSKGNDTSQNIDENFEKITKLHALLEKAFNDGDIKKLRDTLEKIKEFGTAIVLAIALRSFVVEPFKIPSASMIPTLQIGDHIFVAKFSYGVSFPYLTNKKYFWKRPERGDVIVFRPPHEPEKDFIKRVVGEPGDVLEVRDSVLYINGIAVPRCKIAVAEYQDRDQETLIWNRRKGVFYLERIGNTYYIVINNIYSNSSWGPEKVPEGMLYVMGDNRDNSFDSRAWGGVPFENIKGEGVIIWWSNGPGPTLRFNRMGRKINGFPIVDSSIKNALKSCISELKSAKTVSN